MKKKILIGAVIVAVPLAGLLIAARTLYPANVAETSAEHADAALRARRYRVDLKTFAAEAERIVPTLSTWGANWKHAATEIDESSARVRAEVPVVVFTDDLEISAAADRSAAGFIVVNVRSNSRVGKSDFGENRRHVLKILGALDEKFGPKN